MEAMTVSVSRAVCPSCGAEIVIAPRIKRWDWVTCPHCEADLEATSLEPPVLDWAYDGPEIAGGGRLWSPRTRWDDGL